MSTQVELEQLRKAARRAFEFLQDKTFRPEADNRLCDEIVNDLAKALSLAPY